MHRQSLKRVAPFLKEILGHCGEVTLLPDGQSEQDVAPVMLEYSLTGHFLHDARPLNEY